MPGGAGMVSGGVQGLAPPQGLSGSAERAVGSSEGTWAGSFLLPLACWVAPQWLPACLSWLERGLLNRLPGPASPPASQTLPTQSFFQTAFPLLLAPSSLSPPPRLCQKRCGSWAGGQHRLSQHDDQQPSLRALERFLAEPRLFLDV